MTRMQTAMPARKVTASALGSAISILIIFALREWTDIEIREGVSTAIVTVSTFVVGYLVPPAARDQVTGEIA